MTIENLDRKILEIIANDPGISLSSLLKQLRGMGSDFTLRTHIEKLDGTYLRTSYRPTFKVSKKGAERIQSLQAGEEHLW
jgi:hypothetical protein